MKVPVKDFPLKPCKVRFKFYNNSQEIFLPSFYLLKYLDSNIIMLVY